MDVVIPGYEIVKEIGKGGMATVYVAVQNSFDRQVALKIMARHLTGDDVFSERFFREARIIASLNHRNIVPVFDVGRAGDHHYLSMEYLPGGDLKQRLKQGMRADEALHVIYEIAMALSYAHSKSYIHRDIKPENILFREDNTVVLTDFGIAKALDTSDCNMTSTGMIVGSPHYMSPEQALARDIDTRSDIYSLGVVFYEVLVGRPLYDANSSVAAAIKHISEPIPQLPQTFAYLQPILERMVAKAPADRFQSALEVAQALEPYLRTAPDNWQSVVLQDFESETEGGTRIMVRSTGQHGTSVATPAPMPSSRAYSASAPTLHGAGQSSQRLTRLSDVAVQWQHRMGDALKHGRDWVQRERGKAAAIAAGVVLLAGAVAVVDMQDKATASAPVAERGSAAPATKTAAAQTIPEVALQQAPEPARGGAETAVDDSVSVAAPAPANDVLNDYLVQLEQPASDLESDPEYDPESDVASDAAFSAAADADTAQASAVTEDADGPLPEAEPAAAEAEQQAGGMQIIASAEAADSIENAQDQAVQVALLQTVSEQPLAENPSAGESMEDYTGTAEVEALVARADGALRRDRLMVPLKNSAYSLYQQVLALDPDHPAAQRGLDRVVAKYLSMASRQLNAGDLQQAQGFVDRAASVAELDAVSDGKKADVQSMLKAVERVRYLESMEKLETWIAVLRQKENVTLDDLNKAYASYMSVLNNHYNDPKVSVAHDVYANAFFAAGKRYFKQENLEVSRELIAKGLEINPQHEKLQDLNARWQRKKDGDEYFMDRFY